MNDRELAEKLGELLDKISMHDSGLGELVKLTKNLQQVASAMILCTCVHHRKPDMHGRMQDAVIPDMSGEVAELTKRFIHNASDEAYRELLNDLMIMAREYTEDELGVPRFNGS